MPEFNTRDYLFVQKGFPCNSKA